MQNATALDAGIDAETVVNAFTVDVEDYFQVSNFEKQVSRDRWDGMESRVERNTQRLLELLARHNVRGTFFILGWTAERFPELVREIAAAGHELGCHSYWHRLIYTQTPDEFREDVRRAKNVIEDASGQAVVAYRAPSFSITKRSLWALEVLASEGFTIDSSIVPTRHDRYGIAAADSRIHKVETPQGAIWEFPLAVQRYGGLQVPISGGGYFRLFPFSFSRHCFAAVNRRSEPFSFYIHPWEIDPDQPRIAGLSRLSRFRHYVHLRTTEQKLERLLRAFRFAALSDVVARHCNGTSYGRSAVMAGLN